MGRVVQERRKLSTLVESAANEDVVRVDLFDKVSEMS